MAMGYIKERKEKDPDVEIEAATKIAALPWRFGRQSVLNALKDSLCLLGLTLVDLYQLHCFIIHHPFVLCLLIFIGGLTRRISTNLCLFLLYQLNIFAFVNYTVIYKTKVERKDIELVDEEEAQIGANRSSATSNKAEIYNEEARKKNKSINQRGWRVPMLMQKPLVITGKF
ncbi:hypothetical protein JHK87_052778 [Glycine soja]|nr:hypothetical protein JHK87_052778 [Glycine soja]